jgi:hypothetical protein
LMLVDDRWKAEIKGGKHQLRYECSRWGPTAIALAWRV